jgi:TolB protein
VSTSGGQLGGAGGGGLISASRRFVLFDAPVERTIDGTTQLIEVVFRRDRRKAVTEPVSVGRGGPADGSSWARGLSANGQLVVFTSDASDLVRGDTNGADDVFVRNMRTGVMSRVSVPSAQVRSHQANGYSDGGTISADGRFVAFSSSATNLTRRDDTNGKYDVFVRDRRERTTRLMSIGLHGQPANGDSSGAISADGRTVVFSSEADNLVRHDTNGKSDVFARGLGSGVNGRISLTPDEKQFTKPCYSGAVSERGRFVAYTCGSFGGRQGGNNVVAYRRDRLQDVTAPVSTDTTGEPRIHTSPPASISADGRFVAFSSYASLLFPSDATYIYVKDMRSGIVTVQSADATGAPVSAYDADISDDGRLITFWTSKRLLPTDTDRRYDLYLRRVG